MRTIETERLILRAWTIQDAPGMFEYAKSPLVGPSAGWKPHETVEDSVDYLRSAIEKDETWAVTLKTDGRIIGGIGLHATMVEAVRELGYVLHPDFWDMGLMTEAAKAVINFGFEELSLAAITVFRNADNKRSGRVIQKSGFRYDGTLRCRTRRIDGTLSDDCAYSVTRDEWLNGLSETRFCSFVQNRACEYFPCHETNDPEHFNCLFCFCPLYRFPDCGGDPVYLKNGVKDCSACIVPHYYYDRIIAKMKELAET